MVGVSVVQVANGVRHTPLPPLTHELQIGHEDHAKELETSSQPERVLGGFVGGGQLAWRASGPTLEIIEPRTGRRKAAWTFGAIMHNVDARVTSVAGVGLGTISQVVVGVDLGADRRPQGMVALLSLHSSRVTRAFHFTYKVTSVCMVSGGEVSIDPGTLSAELRPWKGMLVVGTAHGTLHLVDLALDLGGHKVLSDEVSPGTLVTATIPDTQAEKSRISSVRQQCHPTVCLSDGMSQNGRFQLIGPDDNVLYETASHNVVITAMTFIPQLASVVIGYNFGAFQIINLSTLTIDCASPFEENMPPVHSFACQEPENDPKNFVYIWLCRSWDLTDDSDGKEGRIDRNASPALCTMYTMTYENKVWIEGHGLWYQGLSSISPRFEFDAIGGLGLKGQPAKPSVVFTAMTVRQTTPNAAVAPGGSSAVSALATPDEDSGPAPEQSLCMFGWVGGVLEQGHINVNHYLAIFDINQWYQAQMPSTLKLDESLLCPYMSFHVLDRVPGGANEFVLGAAPKPASWTRHMSRTCNDSDWFPAALSFDAHVLTSEGLMEYRCQSAQQASLSYLTSCGPSAVVSPAEAHAMCIFSGLIPPDSHLTTTGSTMVLEREALLNVALDQHLVSLLVQCVAEFSEGRFTNLGCSLPSLLDWAWSRVCAIKATNDSLSLPLFDPDCGDISAESITTLHQNLNSLASLTTVVTSIRDYAKANTITMKGAGELESRVQVVSLLMLHLSVVLWFYHCGLLSHSPSEDVEECNVPFPADLLCQIYKNRRSEIKRLSSTLSGSEILMIDGLLEDTDGGSGGSTSKAWEKEGGSGQYPPPSLHALLAIFLLPDVSTTTKHRIVQYLFLDLASLLSDGYTRVVEELVKYPSSFSLSPSHIKLTQAFWLLDHKDFQEGLNVLLDPLVNTSDITPNQHRRIVKAFLYQGEHTRALTYAQIRQPPKVDLDDIRLHLTLLLANGLIREAFHYQRTHRVKDNSEDLLNHLYTGCEQLGKLESVVHLPLSPLEEDALVAYLQTSSCPAAQDYLLVYYLQRSRYDEAAVLQNSQRGALGTAKKRFGARSALIHGYLTHLPDVAKKLSSTNLANRGQSHTVYNRPQPLSAQIRQAASTPKTAATSINKNLQEKQDIWSIKRSITTPYTPFRSKAQRRRGYGHPDAMGLEDSGSPKFRDSTRELSRTVFPSRIEASQSKFFEDADIGLFSPAAKRSRPEVSLLNDDTSRLMESVLRKSIHEGLETNTSMSQNISSDLLSLLQTPKIRKRKPLNRSIGESPLVDTPQSILKVRQMVQRPMSPSAASDSSIPVFPKISKRASISTATEEPVLNKSTETAMTPKQLRFDLPKKTATQVDEKDVSSDREDDEALGPLKLDDYDEEEEDDGVEEEAEEEEEEEDVQEEEMIDEEEDAREEEMVDEEDVRDEEEEDVQEESVKVDLQKKEDEPMEEEEVEVEEEEEDLNSMEVDENMQEEAVADAEDDELEEENEELLEVTSKTEEHLHTVLSHQILQKRSPARRTASGVPSPRQPLPSYVAKAAEARPLKSVLKASVDEVDHGKLSDDDVEFPSRDTTVNEDFYSFTEEEEVNITEKSIVSDAGTEEQKEISKISSTKGVEEVNVAQDNAERKGEDNCIGELLSDRHAVSKMERSVVVEKKTIVIEEKVKLSPSKPEGEKDIFENETEIADERSIQKQTKLQEMNDSEHFGPLHFSDSESEDEFESKAEVMQVPEVSKQNVTLAANGKDEEKISPALSEEEIDFIAEALSKEDDLQLELDTAERFSPLQFSDSENESEDSLNAGEEEAIKKNGTNMDEIHEMEEIKDHPVEQKPVSVEVTKTQVVIETTVLKKTIGMPSSEDLENIGVENNNQEISKDVQNLKEDGDSKDEKMKTPEKSSTNGSAVPDSILLTNSVISSTEKLVSVSEGMDVDENKLVSKDEDKENQQSHKTLESKTTEKVEKELAETETTTESIKEGETALKEKCDVDKTDMEVDDVFEEVMSVDRADDRKSKITLEETNKQEAGAIESIETMVVEKELAETESIKEGETAEKEKSDVDKTDMKDVFEEEVTSIDRADDRKSKIILEETNKQEVSAVESIETMVDVAETRSSHASRRMQEKIQTIEATPSPNKSPRPSSRADTPSREVEEVAETSKVASLRRSRRLSTSSPSTPATPRRSRRVSGNAADAPVTPAHKALISEAVFERVTRSGRKIGQVPTPVTKKKASSPSSNLVTSARLQQRTSVSAEDVQKVAQRLELPTEDNEEAPAAIQQHESAIATHDVLPTPPSSPTTPSRRQRRKSSELEGSAAKSPSRHSTRQNVLEDSLGTIEEEGESSENQDLRTTRGKTTPRKSEGTPNKATPTKATPTRTRRYSAKQTATVDLATIKEDAELSTEVVPLVLDEQITGTPSRRTRRSLAGESSRTPLRQAEEAVPDELETTPERKTPSRTRRGSISKLSEATPEIRTPRRSRRLSGASDISDTAQETKTPTRRTRRSVAKDAVDVTPEVKTPSRTRRQSVSSDISEAAPEPRTPSRRTRQSIAKDATEAIPETRTPSRTRRASVSSDVSEATSESQVKTRRGRQSISEGLSEIASKTQTPTQKAQAAKSTRRRTIQVLQTEEEDATSTSEMSQRSPDRMSTRSSVNSPLTSIKDSESSEEDEVAKKKATKRQSEKSGRKSSAEDKVSEEVGRRKSRRLTTTLPPAMVSELPEKIMKGKPPRKSVLSSNLYSDTDVELPESESPIATTGNRRKSSKRSIVASNSVLILEDEEDEEEEMVLEGGLETMQDFNNDEVTERETADSPDNWQLLEVGSKTRRKLSRSLFVAGATKKAKKKSILPKRSMTSMKLAIDALPKEEEEVETAVKRTRKSSRHTSTADMTVLELKTETREFEGEETKEKKVQKVERKKRSVKGAKNELENQGMPVDDVDVALGKKLGTLQETSETSDEAVTKGKLPRPETTKEAVSKCAKDEQVTQFHFATPKPVISSRKTKALEHLMGEAVEFLFSPPLAEGRIAKTHAKIEETRSSASESDGETAHEKSSAR